MGGGCAGPSPLTDPGGGVCIGLPLPSRPRRPGRGQGPKPGGCPHRVPHEPLEAEALLLGGAPRDDERLRLLAGPGRPRGRGRRHAPAASAPRPAPDVTPRDAPGLRGRRRLSWRQLPPCGGRAARGGRERAVCRGPPWGRGRLTGPPGARPGAVSRMPRRPRVAPGPGAALLAAEVGPCLASPRPQL